jgi:hypothetical protein
MRAPDKPPFQNDADRQTAALGGLAVALLLILVGLLVCRALWIEARLEDCLLAGRLGCEVTDLRSFPAPAQAAVSAGAVVASGGGKGAIASTGAGSRIM